MNLLKMWHFDVFCCIFLSSLQDAFNIQCNLMETKIDLIKLICRVM